MSESVVRTRCLSAYRMCQACASHVHAYAMLCVCHAMHMHVPCTLRQMISATPMAPLRLMSSVRNTLATCTASRPGEIYTCKHTLLPLLTHSLADEYLLACLPLMRSDMHARSNSRGPMAPSPSRSHAPKSCSSRVAFEPSAVSSCGSVWSVVW